MADTRSAHSPLDTRPRQVGGGDDLLAPSGPAIHVAPTMWGLVIYAAVVHGRELNNLSPSRRTRARADAGRACGGARGRRCLVGGRWSWRCGDDHGDGLTR